MRYDPSHFVVRVHETDGGFYLITVMCRHCRRDLRGSIARSRVTRGVTGWADGAGLDDLLAASARHRCKQL
jgi:hypothetical protein